MKTKITLLVLTSAMAFASCGGEQAAEVVTTPVTDTIPNQVVAPQIIIDTFKVETGASSLKWTGAKEVGKSHNGFIRIKEGWIGLSEQGKLINGNIIVDMTAIVNMDLKDEKSKGKLVDHLKSKDFFVVDSFPTAQFTIISATDSTVTGDLTIKNTTNSVTFPYSMKMMGKADMVVESKKFSIDRMKWGVTYNAATAASVAKENIISDLMELQVSLTATKK
ncbi:MAG: YceI family protein [Bacteroidetes bacterium]|nr:YceI family protein [Bacteroidota bacterium]